MKKNNLYVLLFLLTIPSGQSLQELSKMKKEYEDLKNNQSDFLQPLNNDTQLERQDVDQLQRAIIVPYESDIDTLDILSKYFGYSFFTGRDTVSFSQNIPIPPNYLLGPGDELVISLWGETQMKERYTISRDGEIFDEKVGPLNLTGKTLEESQKFLISQFGEIYATLKGRSPSTYLDVSIGKLQSINVNFVGEVNYPGVYPLHPFSNIIIGLIQAGGVDTTGSLRNIQIKRFGQEKIEIDLYDYLLKGNLPNNIQLRDQDIVIIPTRISTVTIDSSIYRPGIYESVPGETIKDMIIYAGGLKPNASSSIGLSRIVPIEKRKNKKIFFENYYLNYDDINNQGVQTGDHIIVRPLFSVLSQVEIIGQVKNPGKYNYYPGMTLVDLFKLGGGLEDSSFVKSIFLDQAELVRRNPNTRYETVIEINLNEIIDDPINRDIVLQNLDRFVVHANLNFFEKKNILIIGEVNIPGSYPLVKDNETLGSLIGRSGGLTSKALEDGISIYREKKYFDLTQIEIGSETNLYVVDTNRVRVAWDNEGISLMPGDSIIVKESTGTVNISGEIYNPGLIEYKKGKSLGYYLNASGGLTDKANKKGIIVIYANGIVNPKKWYSNPRIKDGATIVVNKKEIQEPFNITQFATNWTSIISSMITAIVLSQQLGGSS